MDVLDVLGYIMDEIDVDSFINPEIGCFCGFPSKGCLGNCYFAKKISENHYEMIDFHISNLKSILLKDVK